MATIGHRPSKIAPSATLAITDQAAKLRAEGKDVIALSAGEPDFTTPAHIIEAARQALETGYTHYPPVAGYKELREAIAQKLKTDNALDFSPDEILVSVGAKQAIYLTVQEIADEDDEILIPLPFWVSYSEIAKLAGAKPVFVETSEENNFAPTLEALEKASTEKTKAIIYSSPSNPAGTLYSREQLRVIAEFAKKHDLWIISDEIYEKLIYAGEHISVLNVAPDVRDNTIIINGFSKAYAMTGWRIGYLAANKILVEAAKKLQGHINTGVAAFVQQAAIAALKGTQKPLEEMRQAFDGRRQLMYKLITNLPDITCPEPLGAFYCFPNISNWIGRTIKGVKIENSTDFAKVCLNEALVAVVPGTAFGLEGFVRLSFATSEENIEKALARIAELLQNP